MTRTKSATTNTGLLDTRYIKVAGGNSAANIIIENDTSDGDISFKVNDGGVDKTVMTIDGATGGVGINTTIPLGSDGFAEDAVLSIVAPLVGGTGRERILHAKVVDSNNYFSVINTTSGAGIFIPTFVGYAADSTANQGAVSFDGRITLANDTASGIPVITFRAQQLDGTTAITNRPIAGFGAGTNGNDMKMVVMASGNVGIGTVAPGSLVEVSKSQDAYTYVNVINGNVSGTSAKSGFKFGSGASNAGFFEYENAGYNAGAGTELLAPDSAVFGVTSGATNGMRFVSAAAGSPIIFGTGGYAAANERMRITSTGNVGIGTTAPDNLLHLYSSTAAIRGMVQSINAGSNVGWRLSAKSAGGTQRTAGLYFVPGNTDATTYLSFAADDATDQMIVTRSGNVGIGTVSPTAYLMIKAGTATASTAPLKFTTGVNLTTPLGGEMEYDNTFHLTNSDATRRHIVTAPNTTKVTAAAPYTNDGYIVVNIGGTDFKLMTVA